MTDSIILFCASLHLKYLHRLELLLLWLTGKKRVHAHVHAHTCNIDMSLSLLITCQPLCHAGLTSLKSLIKADNGAASPWCIISTEKLHFPLDRNTHVHTHSAHKVYINIYVYLLLHVHIQTHMNTFGRVVVALPPPRSHRPLVLVFRIYVFWWYESWLQCIYMQIESSRLMDSTVLVIRRYGF